MRRFVISTLVTVVLFGVRVALITVAVVIERATGSHPSQPSV